MVLVSGVIGDSGEQGANIKGILLGEPLSAMGMIGAVMIIGAAMTSELQT